MDYGGHIIMKLNNRLTEEELWKVVDNLIGDIEPIGETNHDNISYEQLKLAMFLVDRYLDIFAGMLKYCNRPEYSMQRSGNEVFEYIKSIRHWCDAFLPEEK